MKQHILLSLAASATLMAAENIGTITVEDVTERLERFGKLKDVIVKTEVITEKAIEKSRQQTSLKRLIMNRGFNRQQDVQCVV